MVITTTIKNQRRRRDVVLLSFSGELGPVVFSAETPVLSRFKASRYLFGKSYPWLVERIKTVGVTCFGKSSAVKKGSFTELQ
jgi:TctA family transporter